MDRFLEEQIKRIQELTRQVTSVAGRSAELSQEIERDRDSLRYGPLQEVRDLRTYSESHERSTRDDRSGRAKARRRKTRVT
jgi:hypothetical protein